MTSYLRQRTGKLAWEYCRLRLPLMVLQSAAGWYIGTFDEDEGPVSRESFCYWSTKQAAERALSSGDWEQSDTP